MYKTCLLNRIIRKAGDGTHSSERIYKCYICNLELSDHFDSVEQHMKSKEHLNRIGQIDVDVELEKLRILRCITESQQKEIFENSISFRKNRPGFFFCHRCLHELNGIHQVFDHMKDHFHVKNLKQEQSRKCQTKLLKTEKNRDDASSKESGVIVDESDHVSDSVRSAPIMKTQIRSPLTHSHRCLSCREHLQNPMVVQCHVMQHLWREINFPPFVDIIEFRCTKLVTHVSRVTKSNATFRKDSLIEIEISKSNSRDLKVSNLEDITQSQAPVRGTETFNHEISLISKEYGMDQSSAIALYGLASDKIYPHLGTLSIECCLETKTRNIYSTDLELFQLLNAGINLMLVLGSNRYCFPCRATYPTDLNILLDHLQSQTHIENLNRMVIEDIRGNENKKSFSALKLAKLLIKKESESILICCICDINNQIQNNYDNVVAHYKTAQHIRKSIVLKKREKSTNEEFSSILQEPWYYAESFACKICDKEYTSDTEIVEHLQESEHTTNVNQCDVRKLRFHICPYCRKYWYGSPKSYSEHCDDDLHKCLTEENDSSISRLQETDELQRLFRNLNELVDYLTRESEKLQQDVTKEREILKCLQNTVKDSYQNAKAYSFGSRISFLGFSDSDINIFLDCEDENYLSGCSDDKIQCYLSNVCKDLSNQTDVWTVTEISSKTKEPMIRLFHEPTGLDCEIHFLNGLIVEKSKLVRWYNAASPCCRQMILFLREWMKYSRCLSVSNYTINMTISWCVIFYLQVQGILPCVLDLVKQSDVSKIIDGWECGFNQIVPQNLPDFNVPDHLHAFFSYFASFDYQKSVACLYLGRIIAKHDFAHTDQLPKEMDIYKFRASANVNEVFQFNSPMCIQDPFDMSHNVTKNVNKSDLRRFRQYCTESAEIMAQKLGLI
ncbi:hypothetical protein QAD02_000890 [Eretmocerus hayati]|uniref:Uncharacterized protein n=1 Tax=Eretmocerus hayati TaxID=131215 RepID=A0ACC2NFF7_9HYME|nr:hypothetical protein QAD02_000890 [Eretmocerus hayati]